MSSTQSPRPTTENERRAEFTGWVRAFTGDLLRYTRARVREPEVAEDIVQLTFVSAWETLERFAGDSAPRTWLFSILKHKLADHYRKAYREAKALSGLARETDSPDTEQFKGSGHWLKGQIPGKGKDPFWEEEESAKMERALRHCLDELPQNLRSAVEMKYLMQQDSAAIQEALEITATNYWQQVHRAKLRLRKCIEGRLGHK